MSPPPATTVVVWCVALNWIYRPTQADCIILGASRSEQYRENLAARQGAVFESWAKLRGVAPQYNHYRG